MKPMSLSSVKYEILETMLLLDKPERATQIAKAAKKEFPSAMMHILGLARMGYVTSPEKGLYTLTEKGKRALGLPEINRENIERVLAEVTQDKEFHFYERIGNPLNLHANSLQDFGEKILKVNDDSIEFHKKRGDFEAWFAGLGDLELAKKASLLKEKKMDGEEMRIKLHNFVVNRCNTLSNAAKKSVLSESATAEV
jgi:hypothetical protein